MKGVYKITLIQNNHYQPESLVNLTSIPAKLFRVRAKKSNEPKEAMNLGPRLLTSCFDKVLLQRKETIYLGHKIHRERYVCLSLHKYLMKKFNLRNQNFPDKGITPIASPSSPFSLHLFRSNRYHNSTTVSIRVILNKRGYKIDARSSVDKERHMQGQ